MRVSLAAVCLLVSSVLDAQEVKVRLCDGRGFQGKFESDGNGKCRILSENGSCEFEETDIVSLEIVPPPRKRPAMASDRSQALRLLEAAKAVGATMSKVPVSFFCKEMRKYFPLAVGDFWVYKVGESEVLQRMEITEILRGEENLRVYYILEDIYKNYRTSKVGQLVAGPDAVYLASEFGMNGRKSFPFLRFPAIVCVSCVVSLDSQKVLREVRSLTATVATPAGSFPGCLEVSLVTSVFRLTEETRIVSRRYYAPNVGLVKLEFDDPSYRKLNLELVDYGPK